MSSAKKLISIIIPAYNEEEALEYLYEALQNLMTVESKYAFEILIVENGSSDRTYEILCELHQRDPRIKVIQLTRNFTCDGGISAGLAFARGDAAVMMYADLQDPPELISTFLRYWEEGFQNVYGVVNQRKDEKVMRGFNSKMFYLVLDQLTGGVIPKNVGDFRLVDRSLYESINNISERNRILRGLFAWTGGKSIGVTYDRKERVAGQSKSHVLYTLNFATKAIFSFSYFPMTVMTWFGLFLGFFALATLFVWSIRFVFWGVPFDGFGTIIGLMLLLFSFVFLMMGVMGKYIGMIFEEVKGRPNFIVQNRIGFDPHPGTSS